MIFFYKIVSKVSSINNKLKILFLRLDPKIKIGKSVIIESGVVIRSQYGGSITIGDLCYLSRGVQILTHGGDIKIGNNSTINPYTVIYGQGGTSIGDFVRIAAHCTIVPSNHIIEDKEKPIYLQGLSKKGIIIENDVWIGTGVRVLDGVTIKTGCVIGAGSVLTKSTVSLSVYVGVPAKKIKNRGN
jgi:acetyltransferase-like isoleucine patch superfamily enzyme